MLVLFSTFCLASSIPSFRSFVKCPGFDLYARIKKIVASFVGMWIPRSGIQVIVESVGKSEDFSMLPTMTSFPQSFLSEAHESGKRRS